jgi:hypothetical protein
VRLVHAAVVLANNPVEAGSALALRRYQAWWRWVARTSLRRPRAIAVLGPLLLLADQVALRSAAAPSSKLLLLRRPADGAAPVSDADTP